MPKNIIVMKNNYFNATGEIAFRMWMFSNAVEALKANPNPEKAENLKGKMKSFSKIISEKGTAENISDIEALIKEL